LLLGKYLDEGEGSPLASVNISLDAINPERFSRITRAENSRPEEIIPHIDRLLEMHVQVKVNCVPIRGFNEEEIIPLALLAREKNIAVRFIELMPLGSARDFEPIPGDKTVAIIEKAFGTLSPFYGLESNGPAVYYSLQGFVGKIGFINPVSHGFCHLCNRLRLTSEGLLKLCLSSDLSIDLRTLLRSGVSDNALAEAITETVAKKPRFHTLSGVYGEAGQKEVKTDGMFEIGG
jgi:cyclic pyranopterin phosphate synthase